MFGGNKPALSVSEARPGVFSYNLQKPREMTRRRIRTWAILAAAFLLVLAAVAYPHWVAVVVLGAVGAAVAGVAVWAHWTRSRVNDEAPEE